MIKAPKKARVPDTVPDTLTLSPVTPPPPKASNTLEYHPTPAWAVEPVLEHLLKHAETDRARADVPRMVIDPFAGDGAILRVFRRVADVGGVELEPSRARECTTQGIACTIGDSISDLGYLKRCRWLVTNPPFSQAHTWLSRLLPLWAKQRQRPIIAALLPLYFLETKERAQLHSDYPAHIMVFSERVSFTGRPSDTFPQPVAWFVWGDHLANRWSLIRASRHQPSLFEAEEVEVLIAG